MTCWKLRLNWDWVSLTSDNQPLMAMSGMSQLSDDVLTTTVSLNLPDIDWVIVTDEVNSSRYPSAFFTWLADISLTGWFIRIGMRSPAGIIGHCQQGILDGSLTGDFGIMTFTVFYPGRKLRPFYIIWKMGCQLLRKKLQFASNSWKWMLFRVPAKNPASQKDTVGITGQWAVSDEFLLLRSADWICYCRWWA